MQRSVNQIQCQVKSKEGNKTTNDDSIKLGQNHTIIRKKKYRYEKVFAPVSYFQISDYSISL